MVSKQQSKILTVLQSEEKPITSATLSVMLNTSEHTARTQLYRLLAERLVTKLDDGTWKIGTKGGRTSVGLIDILLEELKDGIDAFVLGENNIVSIDPDWDDLNADEVELVLNDPESFFKNIQQRIQDSKHISDDPFISLETLSEQTPIRSLGADHKGKLVMLSGDVVTYRPVERRIVAGAWQCPSCLNVQMVHYDVGDKVQPPQVKSCEHNSKPLLLSQRCLEEDEQWFVLEESTYDEAVKPSVYVRVPCWIVERLAEGRKLRVGNTLRVVGIYRSYYEKDREGNIVPVNYIEASSFSLVMSDIGDLVLSEDDEARIKSFALEERAVERLEKLVAPHIYGMGLAKRLTLLASVYGPFNEAGRQNVNVLLLGHTGTAKSTLLAWWKRNYPRTNMISGPGSSSAGLYGMALRSDERLGGRFSIIQGVIPRSHGGLALLDEVEKQIEISGSGMLHEALEHRRVSIDRGDAHTVLKADCAVFMASNWKNMLKPDEQSYLVDCIPKQIPPTILSRCVLLNCDKLVSSEENAAVSLAIIDKHRGVSHDTTDKFIIKYLCMARRFQPKLTDDVVGAVNHCFSLWEKQASGSYGGIDVTKRLLEDFFRLVKSSAMIHLRDYTTLEDVAVVMPIFQHMLEEFAMVEGGGFDVSLVSGAVVGEEGRRLEEEALRVLGLKGGLALGELLVDVPGVDVERLIEEEKIREVKGILYRAV